MNYLAHAYLSFDQPYVLAGNMTSDFIKGKLQYAYDPRIQIGIKLHRAIDEFTDSHPVIKQMKTAFKAKYGLYAGAFTDIVCDFFLANDDQVFKSPEELAAFSSTVYRQISSQIEMLPDNFQQYFVYMKSQDWLFNYQFDWFIQKSFSGLVSRAKFMDDAITAFQVFQDNKESMRMYYLDFFPLLKAYSQQTLYNLQNKG